MNSTLETVARYRDEQSRIVEIDHLGICHPEQRGEYAVYRGGEQLVDFATFAAMDRSAPLDEPEELIAAARAALAEVEPQARRLLPGAASTALTDRYGTEAPR